MGKPRNSDYHYAHELLGHCKSHLYETLSNVIKPLHIGKNGPKMYTSNVVGFEQAVPNARGGESELRYSNLKSFSLKKTFDLKLFMLIT